MGLGVFFVVEYTNSWIYEFMNIHIVGEIEDIVGIYIVGIYDNQSILRKLTIVIAFASWTSYHDIEFHETWTLDIGKHKNQ